MNRMNVFRSVLRSATAGLLLGSLFTYGQAPASPTTKSAVVPYKVQGNVWMIVGAGANIAMQVGKEGILLVDTGAAGMTDAVLAAVRQVSDAPIRYVINTSITADHVGGNAVIGALPNGSKGRGPTPNMIAHESVLSRMSTPGPDRKSPFPSEAWPTDGYIAERRAITFNGEAIDILHAPNAHSDGDTIVYFRASNVVVAGDIFSTNNFPLLDRKLGGTWKGALAALNVMMDLAVPEVMQEGGTLIIPGRGRICDEADLLEYRDMVNEIQDRMQNLVNVQHLTLDQVKAKRPLLGWEGRYGRPEWTTDMVVDALYQEVKGGGAAAGRKE
jgi:glyoxylase-like metal-dependent hydrolase (beta-lactamase superfamily II)